ncbi:MAG: cold shock domain-containing protein [Methylococcaceae bacterium]|nr:cold shock domain-containing protein [Methylococcaceae bacterium]
MTETKIKGVLKTWKADRGFGFIKPDDGGQDIFIHISSLKKVSRRPVRGDVIYYEIAKDNHGKLKAVNATIEGAGLSNKKFGKFSKINKWLIATVIGLLVVGIIVIYFFSGYR